jgi:hypothetical protein
VQLTLEIPAAVPPPAAAPLPDRLYRLGLPRHTPVTLTRNRTILLSWHARRGLRVHAGYAAAPDDVLHAMVRFIVRRLPRAERLAARRVFMAFPAHSHAPSRPPRVRARPVAPADLPLVERLFAAHHELNQCHFDGALATIPILLSDRMRRRLGEFRIPRDGRSAEIVLSRRHLRRDGWEAACETLLHEMIHQWQAATGRPVDHRRDFGRKARAVGISPRAVVDL